MIKDRIKFVMREIFMIDNIDDNISQYNCSKWDSLHHLMLIVELESEFDISFEPEDISEMKSFSIIETKISTSNLTK